jgi:hypothetical protein
MHIPLSCRREAFVVPFIPGTVPAWSDACFEPVEWPNSSQPRSDGDQGWHIIRSPATDADGWVYGTAFDHLREDRPGGRASKRANDRVRSRLWRRVAWEQPTQQQQQQAGAQVRSASWSLLSCGYRLQHMFASKCAGYLPCCQLQHGCREQAGSQEQQCTQTLRRVQCAGQSRMSAVHRSLALRSAIWVALYPTSPLLPMLVTVTCAGPSTRHP